MCLPWTPTNPGSQNLYGKDGLSREHPSWEIWNWGAQRLSWETKLGWVSEGVTTREQQGHSQLARYREEEGMLRERLTQAQQGS